jgi:AcrR family transcriptional regulator
MECGKNSLRNSKERDITIPDFASLQPSQVPHRKKVRARSLDRICETALTLFVKKGYRSTTVDEIARKSGLTKGAVYYYFKSKEALLGRLLDLIERDYPLHRPAQGDAAQKLVEFIHVQARYAVRRPNDLLLLVLMSIEFNDRNGPIKRKISRIYQEMCTAVERIMAEGKESGIFCTSLSPSQLAHFYMAAHDGNILQWYREGRIWVSGADLVRSLRTTLLRSLGHS